MKQLSQTDIDNMIGDEFHPQYNNVRHAVRRELKLSTLIPQPDAPVPRHAVLDLHQMTEEMAWDAIMSLAQSGARTATIITGASGILRIKFPQWARESLLSPYIVDFYPINNGSFAVKFKKKIV